MLVFSSRKVQENFLVRACVCVLSHGIAATNQTTSPDKGTLRCRCEQGCFFAFEQFQVVDIRCGGDKTDFGAHVVESLSRNDDHEVSTRHVIAWPITRLHAPTVIFRPDHNDMEFPLPRSACAYQMVRQREVRDCVFEKLKQCPARIRDRDYLVLSTVRWKLDFLI